MKISHKIANEMLILTA